MKKYTSDFEQNIKAGGKMSRLKELKDYIKNHIPQITGIAAGIAAVLLIGAIVIFSISDNEEDNSRVTSGEKSASESITTEKDTTQKSTTKETPETTMENENGEEEATDEEKTEEATTKESTTKSSQVTQYTTTPIDSPGERSENGWYKYQYTISRDNFINDGIYIISTTSKDSTGNVSQILKYDDLYVKFAVDNTKPEIVMVSGTEKGSYNAEEITVTYRLFDALGVKEVRVYANDEEIYKANEFNDNMDLEDTFNIKAGVKQKIRFEIEDMAGNVTDSTNKEDIESGKVARFNDTVTITTNFLVRWYSNKVALFGSIGAVVAAAVVLIYMKTGYKKKA